MTSTFAWALLCSPIALGSQDTSEIPGSKLASEDRLLDVIKQVDPALAGWDTEVISSKAQLLLGELVTSVLASPDSGALPDFVDSAVRSSALHPEELRVLHDAGGLRIARGTIGPEIRIGHAPLFKSIIELWPAGSETSTPQTKIKIVRIEAGQAGKATTQGLFRIWAETPQGPRQSDSIWTAEWNRRGEELELTSLSAIAYTESSSSSVRFSDCSEAVLGANQAWSEQLLRGTDDWCGRIERGASMDQYGHNGLAVSDINGDGLEDLYACQAGGLPNRLFVQNVDGTATDRSAEYGVDWVDDSKGAIFCDLDGDRQDELVLTTINGIIIATRGETKAFEIAVVLPLNGGYTLAAADYDQDGWVDLFVCGYATSDKKSGLPTPYHDANNGPPNSLFRNLGGLEFEEVTDKVGINQNNTRFSFAASWADYDNDGDQDLYVANDFGRNNLYRNDGGKFRDVADTAGVEDISAGMGVSWRDYDGDGQLDVYVSNMFSSAGQRIAYQRRFKSGADNETRAGFQRHARGNSLFKNQGDGTFADVTVGANVWMGRWSWGAGFTDFDNDGRPDLFVPNGFITNEQENDL
jgi:hypothetical protein